MSVEQSATNRQLESEDHLRAAVEEIANQLCVAVDGEFDFRVNAGVCDETAEKLQMLINFVLDTARRSLSELDERIAELEQTGTALKHESYVLDTLIDQMPNSIYFKDRKSRFTRINAALARRIQLTSPEQAIGKTDFDFFAPEHASEAFAEEQEILKSGHAVVNNEEQEIHSDGRVAWMLTTKLPLRDSSGAIIGTFGISRDITEQKREEDRVRAIVESSPDGLVFVDAEGVIVITNSETERMFGYVREELVGQMVEMLVPERARKTHARQRQAFVREHQSRPVGAHFDFHGQRKDGSEFPVEEGLCPVSLPEGNFVITTIRDVTERKHLEREFRAARDIQRALLPATSPGLSGFEIAGTSLPADSTGGDYYDFIRLDQTHWGIVVGDVSGHGFGPAILTAATHSYLRALLKTDPDLNTVLYRANQLLCEDTPDGRFVTLICVILDTESRTLSYSSAGHIDGLLFDRSGIVKRRLRSTAGPLGLFLNGEFPVGRPAQLEPGDMLVMLTDGFQETVSPTLELLGDERLVECISGVRNKSARLILKTLCNTATEFRGDSPQRDDLTGVVIKVL